MKKICLILVIALLMLACGAIAEDARDTSPEPGTGWLDVEIHGAPVSFVYTGHAAGMTGDTYSFESDAYTLSIMFDKKLEVGVAASENAVQQIELISHDEATSGYYFTKKSSSAAVDSEVLLEQKTDEGLYQGTFKVTVHPGDRWVGDMRPGIIEDLVLDNGAFCFAK